MPLKHWHVICTCDAPFPPIAAHSAAQVRLSFGPSLASQKQSYHAHSGIGMQLRLKMRRFGANDLSSISQMGQMLAFFPSPAAWNAQASRRH